jgi:hypothetical protein
MEDPHAAAFVTELDRKIQELKEDSPNLSYQLAVQDMEKMASLHFPSFDNKKWKYIGKRFKGLLG